VPQAGLDNQSVQPVSVEDKVILGGGGITDDGVHPSNLSRATGGGAGREGGREGVSRSRGDCKAGRRSAAQGAGGLSPLPLLVILC